MITASLIVIGVVLLLVGVGVFLFYWGSVIFVLIGTILLFPIYLLVGLLSGGVEKSKDFYKRVVVRKTK